MSHKLLAGSREVYGTRGNPVIKSSAPAQYNHASTLCRLRSTMPVVSSPDPTLKREKGSGDS